MTTNNQIKNKYEVSSIIGRPLATIDNMLNEARADTEKKLLESEKILSKSDRIEKAKTDTAKQIFKKLDKILVFYPLNQAMIDEIIVEYTTLKKKYNIEE